MTGFTATFVLIATIGAQSTYVLRQGILRQYAITAAFWCILIDVLFIAAGIAGIGLLIHQIPWLLSALRVLGAAYLCLLAWQSIQKARNPAVFSQVRNGQIKTRQKVTREILGITLLNAQMYIDLVLISTLASAFGYPGQWWYYLGAIAASAAWFSGLAFAGAALTPLFQSKRAWQILESATALVMIFVAWHLIEPLVFVP